MKYACIWLGLFFLQILASEYWIKRLNRWRVVQVQKSYGLKSHIETKSTTPSMGGVVFIAVGLAGIPAAFFLADGGSLRAALFLLLPLGAAGIGFADDWIKFSRRSSEGFPSLYKLYAQIGLTLPWSAWVAFGEGVSLCPGLEIHPVIAVPLLFLFAIGMMNAVNVTDGLDGLAAGASLVSFAGVLLWIRPDGAAMSLALAGSAMCAGFLWHNAHPAQVFMGDVGSHFLAGLLVALCVHCDFLIALFPLGFLFGLEIVSVAIQIVAIRKFNRKVFKMSPVHHHFELSGWSETRIVIRFWIIHAVGVALGAVLVQQTLVLGVWK
ncbi:MAG: phospho-N-acetylmuramoyl-pentapeptide-transferase [Synergistaceae bacterium]|nr:phospho-N-acetylmuramoyl-pentapeptide-transferase [Synergistaceae bacterium]